MIIWPELDALDLMRERPTVHTVRFEDETTGIHRAVHLDEGYFSFAPGTPLRVKEGDRWVAATALRIEHAAIVIRRVTSDR